MCARSGSACGASRGGRRTPQVPDRARSQVAGTLAHRLLLYALPKHCVLVRIAAEGALLPHVPVGNAAVPSTRHTHVGRSGDDTACRTDPPRVVAISLAIALSPCSGSTDVSSAVTWQFRGLLRGVAVPAGGQGEPGHPKPWAAWAGAGSIYVMTWVAVRVRRFPRRSTRAMLTSCHPHGRAPLPRG
jgi:hypothetical protein